MDMKKLRMSHQCLASSRKGATCMFVIDCYKGKCADRATSNLTALKVLGVWLGDG